jgi:predicted amidohydrolase
VERLRKVRVALVSPESFNGDEEWKNAGQALLYLDEAASEGAQLVCFPEGYPGPAHGPMDSGGNLSSTPIAMMSEGAKKHSIYVSASNLESNPAIADTYFLTHKLISPTGEIVANYRRCQPNHPIVNSYLYGGRKHVLPGNELMVVPTPLGNLGLLICSELFVPELARIEALMGADILIAPIGGESAPRKKPYESIVDLERNEPLPGWSCLARARAMENLVYTVTTANIFYDGGKGQAVVAGPDSFIALSHEPGVITADLDMERLDQKRSMYVDIAGDYYPNARELNFAPKAGTIHDRRPDFYHKLVEPQPDAFDYFYYRNGLDSWPEEYEKIRRYPPRNG